MLYALPNKQLSFNSKVRTHHCDSFYAFIALENKSRDHNNLLTKAQMLFVKRGFVLWCWPGRQAGSFAWLRHNHDSRQRVTEARAWHGPSRKTTFLLKDTG